MIYEKLVCPYCGHEIGKNNYKQHTKKCDGSYIPKEEKSVYKVDHDDLFCKFCGKECKNLNSLTQHEMRCSKNPNQIEDAKRDWKAQYRNLPEETKRRMAWSKGLTIETSDAVKRYVEHRPKHIVFDYLYSKHNDEEIQKWKDYVDSLSITIPNYTVKRFGKNSNSYILIDDLNLCDKNNPKTKFEHSFLVNCYLNGDLKHENTVHHVDKNPRNNDVHNLIAFETTDDHKRFHNSKYAWLIYNENTHKFTCIIKK